MEKQLTIGLITGTGINPSDIGLTQAREMPINTPYGSPSSIPLVGYIGDKRVILLSRHGHGPRVFLPHNINYRANIMGLMMLGADVIMAISAVGSLIEEIPPGQIVIPDQFIDLNPPPTFFSDEVYGDVTSHIDMAEPICPALANYLYTQAIAIDSNVRQKATLWRIPGPRFSTKAESNLYKKEATLIGMTFPPEAILSREGGVDYAVLANVTDYDCWRNNGQNVSTEVVERSIRKFDFSQRSAKIIRMAIEHMPTHLSCDCTEAPAKALAMDLDKIPEGMKKRLEPIIKKIRMYK